MNGPWYPGQAIPTDLERPCGHNGCPGTFRLVAGTDDYDADGSAMISTGCDTCNLLSAAYWTWTDALTNAEVDEYNQYQEREWGDDE